MDLTGQVEQIEENIDADTIMVGPPDETDPSGEPEPLPEPESDQDALVSESDQDLPVSVPDQEFLVPEVDRELPAPEADQGQPEPDIDQETRRKLKWITLVVVKSQDQTQSLKDSNEKSASSKSDFFHHQCRESTVGRNEGERISRPQRSRSPAVAQRHHSEENDMKGIEHTAINHSDLINKNHATAWRPGTSGSDMSEASPLRHRR